MSIKRPAANADATRKKQKKDKSGPVVAPKQQTKPANGKKDKKDKKDKSNAVLNGVSKASKPHFKKATNDTANGNVAKGASSSKQKKHFPIHKKKEKELRRKKAKAERRETQLQAEKSREPSLVSLSAQNWLKLVGNGSKALKTPEGRSRKGKKAVEADVSVTTEKTVTTKTTSAAEGTDRMNTTTSSSVAAVSASGDSVAISAKISKATAKEKAKKEKVAEASSQSSLSSMKSKFVALDCEMVGVGKEGNERSVLARCSLVDYDGKVLYDKFVQSKEKVINFRTFVSGIREQDIKAENGAVTLEECRDEIGKLLKGKILIGHALKNDLDALMLTHPGRECRDTARYKPFMSGRRPRALRKLVQEKVGMEVQSGEHSSVEDARATMALYKTVQKEWEKFLAQKAKSKKGKR